MLLAASRGGQVSSTGVVSWLRIARADVHRQTLLKPSPGPSSASTRSGNDNQLLIHALTPTAKSPLLALAKRIADAGCNLSESRVSTIGTEISLMLLATGAWDALAKLETALAKLTRDESMRLVHYRTGPRQNSSHLLPYLVEVVAADRPGIVARIVDFFSQHGISVEQLNSTRYQAMQTGADMFQAQFTIGIPAEIHIAALRDDFLELCDGLNLDAIMDPVKF
jgi:glycine cleavage system transcriptional repressor